MKLDNIHMTQSHQQFDFSDGSYRKTVSFSVKSDFLQCYDCFCFKTLASENLSKGTLTNNRIKAKNMIKTTFIKRKNLPIAINSFDFSFSGIICISLRTNTWQSISRIRHWGRKIFPISWIAFYRSFQTHTLVRIRRKPVKKCSFPETLPKSHRCIKLVLVINDRVPGKFWYLGQSISALEDEQRF